MKLIVIVIHCNEDGNGTLYRITEDEFLCRLKEHYWGENPRFLERSSTERFDLDSFVGLVIIKGGDIVVPQPSVVVKEYKL